MVAEIRERFRPLGWGGSYIFQHIGEKLFTLSAIKFLNNALSLKETKVLLYVPKQQFIQSHIQL